jgi:hypothetical protein
MKIVWANNTFVIRSGLAIAQYASHSLGLSAAQQAPRSHFLIDIGCSALAPPHIVQRPIPSGLLSGLGRCKRGISDLEEVFPQDLTVPR